MICHDLKHTLTTFLLFKGTHSELVQEMLGHVTISQTIDTAAGAHIDESL